MAPFKARQNQNYLVALRLLPWMHVKINQMNWTWDLTGCMYSMLQAAEFYLYCY